MTYQNARSTRTIYECKSCDYNTFRKRDYERHISTEKHKLLANTYQILTDARPARTISNFTCECGKEYKHKQSLYNHKKKCIITESSNNLVNNSDGDYKSMFFKIVEENKEVRQLLISQQQQLEQQQTMMNNLIPRIGNNNTINNTTIKSI